MRQNSLLCSTIALACTAFAQLWYLVEIRINGPFRQHHLASAKVSQRASFTDRHSRHPNNRKAILTQVALVHTYRSANRLHSACYLHSACESPQWLAMQNSEQIA